MIWGIVYGALAVATLALLAVPGVRIVTEAKALSRAVAASSGRLRSALAEIQRLTAQPRRAGDQAGALASDPPMVEDGTTGTYDPEGAGNHRRPRRRSRRGS